MPVSGKPVMTGAQLRWFREEIRLSQTELAVALGFSTHLTIWKMEQGKSKITEQHYRLISMLSLQYAIECNDPKLLTALAREIYQACVSHKRRRSSTSLLGQLRSRVTTRPAKPVTMRDVLAGKVDSASIT